MPSIYARYFRLYREHNKALALGVLLALALGLVLLPVPLLFKNILDQDLPNKDLSGLLRHSALIALLYVANLGLGYSSRSLILKVTKAVVLKLRADMAQKLLQFNISYYDSSDLGRLHSQVVQDTEKIDILSNFMVSVLAVSLITGTGTLVLMFRMEWRLATLICASGVLFWYVQRTFAAILSPKMKAWRDEFDSMSSKIQTLIGAIRLIRAYTNEDQESAAIYEASRNVSLRGVEWVSVMSLNGGVTELLMGLSQVAVLLGGGWLVQQGSLSIGSLVAFYTLLTLFFNPVRNILGNVDQLIIGNLALRQYYETLDHPQVERLRLDGSTKPLAGRVDVVGVSYTYESSSRPALNDISVQARPGQTIALVGPSGSGKTTFINLLLGFYRPQAGQILFDGEPMDTFQARSLRAQMAVVSQENLLLAGSIHDNILYGRPGARSEEVEAAARRAQAHDFIMALDHGYQSTVGDRGVMLSGGQRQRIAIARAILRDPKILLLDEATSALDTASEAQVQSALRSLREDRTTFVIAHRLSTIQDADLILVFDKGVIVEKGRHEELLAKGAHYAGLYGGQKDIASLRS